MASAAEQTDELVVCPPCSGAGQLVMSDLVAGYWGYETIETDYTCPACQGSGKLPRDEADLLNIASATDALLSDATLSAEASSRLLEEFLSGLDDEPERLEQELKRIARESGLSPEPGDES